jgi:hypothetical protein
MMWHPAVTYPAVTYRDAEGHDGDNG